MEHRPPTRLGSFFGTVVALALAALAVGLALLSFTAPVSLLTVGRLLIVLLILPAIGLLLINVAALRSARYGVDRNAIVIRWGRMEQVIPLPEVEGILQGIGDSYVSRIRGLRWPGYWRGRAWISGLGSAHFYCSTPADRHLIILTSAGVYAISPQDPDRFMDLYAAQRAMGPSETVELELAQPRIFHQGFLSDRVSGLLLGLGAAINLLLATILASRYADLPHTVILHLDQAGLPDRVGGADQIFQLILLGAVAWFLNGVLGALIYSRLGERMAAYLLWGGGVLLQLLLWVALAGMI